MASTQILDVPYGRGASAFADLHLPPAGQEIRGVAVNLHGGGWYTGDKMLASRCCAALAERGLAVVNANYRISPPDPVPTMVADALEVLRWVRFGSNVPEQIRVAARSGITLAGDSAGAHIAVLTAAAQLDRELAALLGVDPSGTAPVTQVVSWSGALALNALLVGKDDPLYKRFAVYIAAITGGRRVKERMAELDPLRWLSSYALPTLVFTSSADFFHQSAVDFSRAAASNGRPVTLADFDLSHPNCTHSWQLNPSFEESQATYDLTVEFVRSASKTAPTAHLASLQAARCTTSSRTT